ncbi:MAG: triose-phosphate isomerase [Gammaproteobacteria bacterium]|nr:triose-phosphate isomerase [Gammaproteobacteria bacterium]MBU1603399.1 triose-phosphate isomerase [Gammaproteobacteria bacterium]MBU2432919.1 triose-phosphate isomerase [Gammaproteobacteria bacterium]MBU2450162.1 triose-phosphate isomerase [Gammaproteobacteria bacterium]
MRRKLVAGNWKMHGALQQNSALLARIAAGATDPGCEIAVCPPFPYLAQAQSILAGSSVALGAQSVNEHASGPFTGEVSASMLAEFGCRYVLVGHSERRAQFGEADAVVAAKFEAAQKAGLVPILCVGETLDEREAGKTLSVISGQLSAVLDRVGVAAMGQAVVAYEPVWAIGTGLTASPRQAQEVHASIRFQVAELDVGVANGLRILYGGSVKPQNAKELFGQLDIDGGLIGGAALVADDFLAICLAAN